MLKAYNCIEKGMNTLKLLFSSQVRAEVLRVLFGVSPKSLHLREIQRETKLAVRTVSIDLGKLEKLGIVVSKKDGNRVNFSANSKHPLYPEIRNLVLKTSGLADILKEVLDIDGIKLAFIFGSLAQGQEKAESDIDLMVIGNIGLRKLSTALSGLSNRIGREINPHAITRDEFLERIKTKEHFIASVMAAPKLWIKGTDDELTAMGR